MIGSQPTLRGFGKDTFDLTGRRIDFTLDDKDLTGVVALDSAHAVTGDVDLVGDTVSIALKEKKAELTLSWGRKQRPVGLAGDYELRGDSLAIDTPKGELREVRAFMDAWAGTKVDSASGERDWVAGDTVVIRFVQADSSGRKTTRVSQLEAIDSARSFYRVINKGKGADSAKTGQPGLNYARANRIVVRMATTGDGGMERVDLFGKVDGIQLEPKKGGAPPPAPAGPRDTTGAVLKAAPATDSAAVAPKPAPVADSAAATRAKP
jgi:hypothetical protein